MENSTILITGPPRAGTTLTCELLGSLPNTVALDEPLDLEIFRGPRPDQQHDSGFAARVLTRLGRRSTQDSTRDYPEMLLDTVAARVELFASDMRHSALTRGVVRSKSVNGQISGQEKVVDEHDERGLRKRLTQKGDISVGKPLTENFTLAIKHNGSFTACLEQLVARFPVYAVVRNPLSILLSWQAVPMPIRVGHVPFAETLDPGLAKDLAGIDNPVDRQFHVLTWFFGKFARLLPPNTVISYEQRGRDRRSGVGGGHSCGRLTGPSDE